MYMTNSRIKNDLLYIDEHCDDHDTVAIAGQWPLPPQNASEMAPGRRPRNVGARAGAKDPSPWRRHTGAWGKKTWRRAVLAKNKEEEKE